MSARPSYRHGAPIAISPRTAFDRSARDLPQWHITPGEPGWDTARRARNLAVDQRPAAVALPEPADEVTHGIVLARDHGRRVAAQGTGHGADACDSPDATEDHRSHAREEEEPWLTRPNRP